MNKDWIPCHYDGAKIVSPIYPPVKEDGNDHFYPIAEHFPIEEVVAWREL